MLKGKMNRLYSVGFFSNGIFCNHHCTNLVVGELRICLKSSHKLKIDILFSPEKNSKHKNKAKRTLRRRGLN